MHKRGTTFETIKYIVLFFMNFEINGMTIAASDEGSKHHFSCRCETSNVFDRFIILNILQNLFKVMWETEILYTVLNTHRGIKHCMTVLSKLLHGSGAKSQKCLSPLKVHDIFSNITRIVSRTKRTESKSILCTIFLQMCSVSVKIAWCTITKKAIMLWSICVPCTHTKL